MSTHTNYLGTLPLDVRSYLLAKMLTEQAEQAAGGATSLQHFTQHDRRSELRDVLSLVQYPYQAERAHYQSLIRLVQARMAANSAAIPILAPLLTKYQRALAAVPF